MFIDLLPTEDQAMIRDSVLLLIKRAFPVERLRKAEAIYGAAERRVWNELTELGLFGLGVSTDAGGVGYSTAEEVVVSREFGRALVSPLVLSSMLATHVAVAAGNKALADGLIQGTIRAAFANPLTKITLGKGDTIDVQLLDWQPGDHVLLLDDKQAAVFEASALKPGESPEGLD